MFKKFNFNGSIYIIYGYIRPNLLLLTLITEILNEKCDYWFAFIV